MEAEQNTQKAQKKQIETEQHTPPHEAGPEKDTKDAEPRRQKTLSNQSRKSKTQKTNKTEANPATNQTQEMPPENTLDSNLDLDILDDDLEKSPQKPLARDPEKPDSDTKLKQIDEDEEPSNASEDQAPPATETQKDDRSDQKQPKTNSKKSNGSDLLKEDNLFEPSGIQSPNMAEELRTLFPTDNESLETVADSAKLTSRFKKKDQKSRTHKPKRKMEKGAYAREKNFNMTGLIHYQMKEYNSLTDHSLKKFFCSPQKVRHMTKVGLITKSGLIVKNPEIYLKMKRQRRDFLHHLPPIPRKGNRSVKDLHQRSTLSEKEVRKAIKAKSVCAQKKLRKGLSPLGRLKENRRKPRGKKKLQSKNVVTKRKLENYFRQIENLYNLK